MVIQSLFGYVISTPKTVPHSPSIPQRVFSNFAIARPNCEDAALVNAIEMTRGQPFPIGTGATRLGWPFSQRMSNAAVPSVHMAKIF